MSIINDIVKFVDKHQLGILFISVIILSWSQYIVRMAILDILNNSILSGNVSLLTRDQLNFILSMLLPISYILPAIIAVFLVCVVKGWKGLSEWFNGLLKWNVGMKWYILVILLPLLIEALAIVIYIAGQLVKHGRPMGPVLSFITQWQMFGNTDFLLLAITASLGLALGLYGFALPILCKKYSPLISSMVLGIVLLLSSERVSGIIYVVLDLLYNGKLGLIGYYLPLPTYLIPYFFVYLAITLIMVWSYHHTKGSLLVMAVGLFVYEWIWLSGYLLVSDLRSVLLSTIYDVLSFVWVIGPLYMVAAAVIIVISRDYFINSKTGLNESAASMKSQN